MTGTETKSTLRHTTQGRELMCVTEYLQCARFIMDVSVCTTTPSYLVHVYLQLQSCTSK